MASLWGLLCNNADWDVGTTVWSGERINQEKDIFLCFFLSKVASGR